MSTITTAALWLLLPLIVVIGVIGWATESRGPRIRRQRRQGRTWAWIAERQGVSVSTARRWATR
jgi:hypothetical protein